MKPAVVRVQEKHGDSHVSYTFELTYQEFYKGVQERAEPGSTMVGGSLALGDALMVTPALRGMKELLPDNAVHVYCNLHVYTIFENNPHIDFLVAVPQEFRTGAVRHMYDRLCNAYDRSILLHADINGNPEAEWVNAYDIYARKIGVRPSSMIPEYYPLDAEIERARSALEAVCITPGEDRIVAVQPGASSMLRTLPDETTASLLRRLEDDGWKAVVFWNRPRLPEKASNIGCWTCRDLGGLNLREVFALVDLCDAAIATDSVISHLAAALNVPSVVLYGPFRAELRSAYFPKTFPLHATVECSPCFQHGKRCAVEGRGIPSCMRSFTVESIKDALDAVSSPSWSRRPQAASGIARQPNGMTCRMCDCTEFRYYARKKEVLYLSCVKCGTAQLDAPSTGNDFFSTRRHSCFTRFGERDRRLMAQGLLTLFPTIRSLAGANERQPLLLDFGACEGFARRIAATMDWGYEAFEPDDSFMQELKEQNVKVWVSLRRLSSQRQSAFDMVMLLHSFHFLNDPDGVVSGISACLRPGGLLTLAMFTAVDVSPPSVSRVLPTNHPCDIAVIPSDAGLDTFMAKHGFERTWFSRIPGWGGHLFVYRKSDVLTREPPQEGLEPAACGDDECWRPALYGR